MDPKMKKIAQLQQLKEDFNQIQLKTSASQKFKKLADTDLHVYKENLKKGDVEVSKLVKVETELKISTQRKIEKLEELERELTLLLQETEIKDEEKKLAYECLSSSISDKEYMKQKIESAENESNERLGDLQKMDKLFQERLGLKFISTPDQQLQIVLTNIDPKNMSSPFSFHVQFIDGKYKVSNTQPEIEYINSLTEKLNQTNSFRSFIISVRKYYRKKFTEKA